MTKNVTHRSMGEGAGIGLLFFLTSCAGLAIYCLFVQRAASVSLDRQIVWTAQAAAALVDPVEHEKLQSADQEATDRYKKLVDPLRKIQIAIPEIRYIYTMRMVQGEARFILDATPAETRGEGGVQEHSSLMELYEDPPHEMLEVLKGGHARADSHPTTDKWGIYYSGYAPIKKQGGEVIGLVGVDISGEMFHRRIRDFLQAIPVIVMLNFLMSCLIGVATFRYRRATRVAEVLRVKTEEGLSKALLQEKELNEIRNRLLHTVSHEFRSPLTVIAATSGFLREMGGRLTPEKHTQYLDAVAGACKRMETMVDDVLLIGKTQAGKMEFRPEPLDLEAWMRALCSELQVISSRHPIRLEVDEKLRGTWMLDRELLHHIVTNLIGNAIKYSPQGGEVFCGLRLSERGELILDVRDHGIGIPIQNKKLLFQEFFRADNVGVITGTGLGLSILKQAATAHGGSVDFHDAEGGGTIFTIKLSVRKV